MTLKQPFDKALNDLTKNGKDLNGRLCSKNLDLLEIQAKGKERKNEFKRKNILHRCCQYLKNFLFKTSQINVLHYMIKCFVVV